MSADKRAIREALRERRKHLPPTVVAAAGAAVSARLCGFAPYQAALALLAYIATEQEIPTEEAIAESMRAGRPVYLPKAAAGVGCVRWHVGEPLIPGRGGVCEPLAGPPLPRDSAALALVPVVAWDERGTRLGRGGGFYDRLFADGADDIVRVGLAYEFQRWPELPRESWDVPLQYVITEQRVVRCAAEAAVRSELLQKGGLRI